MRKLLLILLLGGCAAQKEKEPEVWEVDDNGGWMVKLDSSYLYTDNAADTTAMKKELKEKSK